MLKELEIIGSSPVHNFTLHPLLDQSAPFLLFFFFLTRFVFIFFFIYCNNKQCPVSCLTRVQCGALYPLRTSTALLYWNPLHTPTCCCYTHCGERWECTPWRELHNLRLSLFSALWLDGKQSGGVVCRENNSTWRRSISPDLFFSFPLNLTVRFRFRNPNLQSDLHFTNQSNY